MMKVMWNTDQAIKLLLSFLPISDNLHPHILYWYPYLIANQVSYYLTHSQISNFLSLKHKTPCGFILVHPKYTFHLKSMPLVLAKCIQYNHHMSHSDCVESLDHLTHSDDYIIITQHLPYTINTVGKSNSLFFLLTNSLKPLPIDFPLSLLD